MKYHGGHVYSVIMLLLLIRIENVYHDFIWRISNFPLFLRQNEDTEICHETLIKKCAFQVHRHLQFSDYLLYSDVKSIKMYINPRLLDQSH